MALPNTDMLTSQLARLPDASLRQLAQMHKNDPYVLPLIISEDGRRKQMRAASQAQAGAVPQPKVVDTAVQQIGQLPEEVGIAALSAPNMAGMPGGGITGEEEPQTMAGGGMVAFRNGGDVERYNGATGSMTGEIQRILQKGPYERTPQDNALLAQAGYNVQRRTLAPDSGVAGVNTFLENLGPRLRSYFTSGASQLSDEELAKLPGDQGLNERILRGLGVSPSAASRTTPAAARATTPAVAASLLDPSMVQPAGLPPGADSEAAAAPEQRRTSPAAAATGAGAPSRAAAPTNLQDIMAQARSMADSRGDIRLLGIKDELTGLSEAEKADARAATQLLRERQAKFADAYKGREERLAKREAEVEGSKEQNAGLALLQAGLAIMSTPGGLATAVGKGGQAGLASYASGLERIKASQEKLADARDRLDEAKLNREETSAKELNEALMAERKAATNARKVGVDFLMKQYNFDREDANKYFDAGARLATTREEIAGRERAARISAGAPGQQMQMALALGGGDVEAGFRKMTEIAAGKFDPKKAYTDYLVAAQKMPGTDLLSYSQFIGQFAIPTAPGNNPAAAPGTVRERP